MSRILITIPTWNEAVVIERNLGVAVEAARRLFPNDVVIIEVADNASTDETSEIVYRVTVENPASVLLRELEEKGKGLAIRSSWQAHVEDSDVLVFMDADLAADLNALPQLIRPIMNGEQDLVCGSRFLPGSRIQRAWHRELASRLYRGLQQMILGLPVADAQCGFKAVSAQAAKGLLPLCSETGWLFDSELIAVAAKKGLRIAEIPVAWIEHRDPSRRSALRLFQHGWGFIAGLLRISAKVSQIKP